jgi:predicted Zn-dependent protease with MMP-like domain
MKTGKIDEVKRFVRLRSKVRRLLFLRRVDLVMAALPDEVRSLMDNVAIVVEDEPRQHPDNTDDLFGLYHGVPRIERFGGDSMALPDHISIYRGPLMRSFGSGAELDEQIRVTVLHELGHHLGLDEHRLEELGLA